MVSISDNDDISDTARYPLVKAHGTWNRVLIYYYYYCYAAFNAPCVGHEDDKCLLISHYQPATTFIHH